MTIVLGNGYAKCIHGTSDICDCGSLVIIVFMRWTGAIYIWKSCEFLRVCLVGGMASFFGPDHTM